MWYQISSLAGSLERIIGHAKKAASVAGMLKVLAMFSKSSSLCQHLWCYWEQHRAVVCCQAVRFLAASSTFTHVQL